MQTNAQAQMLTKMLTNTEYMSDPQRVERVVQRFLALRLGALMNPNTKRYLDYITDLVFYKEAIDKEKAQDMSYADFACLIHQVGGRQSYDGETYDSWHEQMVEYRFLAETILDISSCSIPARMFLELPLAAFYAYLYGVSHSYGLVQELNAIKGSQGYSPDYTIRDYLTENLNILEKSWVPVLALEDYAQRVRDAHQNVGRVLVQSFRLAFPDRFRLASVCRRFGTG